MNVKLLFNPFERIAGWNAMFTGLAAMAATAVLGSLAYVSFDGVLDVHFNPNTLGQAFIMQAVAWGSAVVCMWLAGAMFSHSKVRLVDVAGTMAFARIPMLLLFITFPASLIAAGTAGLIAVIMICILFGAWMVALMWNAYSVSCNLKGLRGGLSFAGALIAAEVLSKLLLYFLLAAPADVRASDTAQMIAIPEGQTVQQTAAKVMDHLSKAEFGEVVAFFDGKMRAGLTEKRLSALWKGLEIKLGAYVDCTIPDQTMPYEDYRIMMIPCRFKRGEMTLQLTFNPDGLISGMFIR